MPRSSAICFIASSMSALLLAVMGWSLSSSSGAAVAAWGSGPTRRPSSPCRCPRSGGGGGGVVFEGDRDVGVGGVGDRAGEAAFAFDVRLGLDVDLGADEAPELLLGLERPL